MELGRHGAACNHHQAIWSLHFHGLWENDLFTSHHLHACVHNLEPRLTVLGLHVPMGQLNNIYHSQLGRLDAWTQHAAMIFFGQ